jgi:hypothetical protein
MRVFRVGPAPPVLASIAPLAPRPIFAGLPRLVRCRQAHREPMDEISAHDVIHRRQALIAHCGRGQILGGYVAVVADRFEHAAAQLASAEVLKPMVHLHPWRDLARNYVGV